jgi:hypothetical protein
MTTRVHYLVDGNANVAFTLRRQEFFIPIGIVLKVNSKGAFSFCISATEPFASSILEAMHKSKEQPLASAQKLDTCGCLQVPMAFCLKITLQSAAQV